MATILQHKKTQEKFILLGAGYGRSHGASNKTDKELEQWKKRSFFGQVELLRYKTVEETYLCVAKEDGSIWWVKDRDVELYKIDGMSPEKALSC